MTSRLATHPGAIAGRLAWPRSHRLGTTHRRAQVSRGRASTSSAKPTGRCDPGKGGLDPNAPELALVARATASDPLDQRRLRAALLGALAQEAASDRVTNTRAAAALASA